MLLKLILLILTTAVEIAQFQFVNSSSSSIENVQSQPSIVSENQLNSSILHGSPYRNITSKTDLFEFFDIIDKIGFNLEDLNAIKTFVRNYSTLKRNRDENLITNLDKNRVGIKKICKLYKKLSNINFKLASIVGSKIKSFAVESFETTLLEGNSSYEMSDEVHHIADQIYFANKSLFDETISEVIDNTYNQSTFRDIINAMWSHSWTYQKATGLCRIFENLSKNMENNGQALFIITSYFKKLKNINDFKDLPQHKQNEVDSCIRKLPKSVKNLYFSKSILIRSASKAIEKLYFSNNHDKNMNIPEYISINGSSVNGSWKHHVIGQKEMNQTTRATAMKWIPISIDDEFKFKFQNELHNNEYLFAGDDRKLFGFWRNVYTWQPSTKNLNKDDDKKMIWHLRFHKNLLTIINEYYNEPLCMNFPDVVTAIFESFEGNSNCHWILEDH